MPIEIITPARNANQPIDWFASKLRKYPALSQNAMRESVLAFLSKRSCSTILRMSIATSKDPKARENCSAAVYIAGKFRVGSGRLRFAAMGCRCQLSFLTKDLASSARAFGFMIQIVPRSSRRNPKESRPSQSVPLDRLSVLAVICHTHWAAYLRFSS